MLESAPMSKDFSRKDLKHQDEFLSSATTVAQWLIQRRKSIGLALLLVVAAVSVLIGVRSYRQRQEQNAAVLLAVGLRAYGSPVTPEDGSAPTAPADEHSAAGHQHFATETEKYEAAAAALRPILEQYGSYPSGRTAAFYLASCLAELQRYDEAEAALQHATEADAPLIRGMALQRLGDLYVQLDRYDDAIRVFDGLIARPPAGFPVEEALAAKARAHEAAGDDQAAMVAYQRLAEDHESSVYALPARTRAEELAAKLGVDLDAQS